MKLLAGELKYRKFETDDPLKTVRMAYPEGLEDELQAQLGEIFSAETYKDGLKKDSLVLDVGANIGMASLYFASHAKKIYALEPNPVIYKALVENTKNIPTIETFNVGIADITSKGYMYSNHADDIPQTLFDKGEKIHAQEVQLLSLEDFLNNQKIDQVDVLKMDVEGSEYLIFPSDSFARVVDRIKFIIGESHFQLNSGFPDVIPLILKDYGFETRFLKWKNYERKFEFTNRNTGEKKEWLVEYPTLFVAERK